MIGGQPAASRASSASTTLAALARSATTVGATRAACTADARAANSSATIARTASTSASRVARPASSGGSAAPAGGSPSVSRPTRCVPGRPATAGSTSRGRARSSRTSGRPGWPRRRSAPVTRSALITTPAAPVQEITRSASATGPARSARSAVLPPTAAASRPARSAVRLATTMCAAPIRAAVVAASELIEPAPTTSTRSPVSGWAGSAAAGPPASRPCATAMPMLTRFAPAWSMPVSPCARRAVRSASAPSSPRPRLSVACSRATDRARRTWPRIWLSPTTMDSRPQDTASRCCTARSS